MSTTGIKPEFKTKPEMKSLIVKRSVVLGGHKTSVSLEDAFWKSLKQIAASGKMTVSELLTAIDSGRHHRTEGRQRRDCVFADAPSNPGDA
jgi:predicted DNA-binding ribbon-helix-helix protein